MSDTGKSILGIAVGVAVFALAATLVNAFTIENEILDVACFILLVFAGNLALALPLRYIVLRSAGKSDAFRARLAAAVVALSLIVLPLDFYLMFATTAEYLFYGATAVASLATALVWVGSFVIVWKPFLDRPENRYLASVVSLVLGCLAMVLFFGELFVDDFFDAKSYQVAFVRFALSCVSFASAISAFLVQWEARR